MVDVVGSPADDRGQGDTDFDASVSDAIARARRGAVDRGRAASPDLPAAASGLRRQFLALQDADDHPPPVPAHGAAPHGRAEAYIAYLEQTPAEVVNLHNDLLIHVTRFFREPESFEFIAREVLPRTIPRRPGNRCACGWPAARPVKKCIRSRSSSTKSSTASSSRGSVQIFGTDVSESAVAFARHGLYAASIAEDVSPERLRGFFAKTDGGYQVTKTLRDMCVFARQDLTRDPPFSHLDLICCRNVLIYMDTRASTKAAVHVSLRTEAVGDSGARPRREHRVSLGPVYADEQEEQDLSQESGGGHGAAHGRVPFAASKPEPAAAAGAAAPHETRLVLSDANRIIMQRYAPPSVLLDQHFSVVQFNGQTGHYLEPSPGEPTFDILKLAREGLSHGLRTALHAARKTRKPVREPGLRVRHGGAWQAVDVEVIPVLRSGHLYYLVLFQTSETSVAGKGEQARANPRRRRRRRAASASSRKSWPRRANIFSRRFRRSKRPTKSCSRRTRRFCRATKSCRARTKSSTPPRKSCSRPTKS